jgi:hypothetical protein
MSEGLSGQTGTSLVARPRSRVAQVWPGEARLEGPPGGDPAG